MDNPPPVLISAPAPKRGLKIFFLLAGLLLLLVGLGTGIFLVQRQETQNLANKAAGRCFLWPVDPADSCANRLSPNNRATGVSTTPSFHWEYEGCTNPTGCSAYGAAVYIFTGDPASGTRAFARCDVPPGHDASSPPHDASFDCFNGCDYGNLFPNDPNTCHTDRQPKTAPLTPSTKYWWRVEPYFNGLVHGDHHFNYSFTTAASTPPGAASCQMVSSTPSDLSKVKIGDSLTFTGFGVTNAETEVIDKINFIITKDGVEATNSAEPAVRDTIKDATFSGKAWKATKSFKVTDFGSYAVRIRVHWKNQDVWKE